MHATFNVIEAAVWSLLAAAIAWRTWPLRGQLRAIGATAALALLAFAASDLVEIRTGAWYRPAWLVCWKAACVGILAACYVRAKKLYAQPRS